MCQKKLRSTTSPSVSNTGTTSPGLICLLTAASAICCGLRMDWCSVTVFANTAFALLIAAMIQQHCYYHHVVRQRVGLSSTPRFGLQVNSLLTIARSDKPQVALSLEAASDRVKRAVVAAGGHLESIQRAVLVVRQTQQQTAAINNDVDLVLLTSWPSSVQFERFKAELEGFSQHVSQGNHYNQMARIIPQILLWVRFTCFIKGIYHDLSIKFTAAQSGNSDKLDAAISPELRFKIDSAMRNGWTGSCEGIYEELCDAAEKEGQVREGELTTRELVQSAVDLSLRNRIQDAANQKGVALEAPMLMWNWSGAAVGGKSNSYYGNTMMQLFMQHGAGPIITGSAINDGFDGVFDSLNAVYYPSIGKFTDILESQFYLELHRHKVLCDALVVLSTPLAS